MQIHKCIPTYNPRFIMITYYIQGDSVIKHHSLFKKKTTKYHLGNNTQTALKTI